MSDIDMPFPWDAIGNKVRSVFCRPDVALPPDMLIELERLGESPDSLEWIAKQEGLDFARFFLQGLTDSAALFDKWYPRLRQFAEAKRAAKPVPDDRELTPTDLAYRRILQPKITDAERVPQRGNFTAAVFTARLVVLPLVYAQWPSTYRNPVFLTPDELREWNDLYDEPEDSQWWFCFQDWDIQPDPPQDSFWLEHSSYSVQENTTPLLVTWGLQWGSLAGGQKGELWCVEADGCETLLGSLGDVSF